MVANAMLAWPVSFAAASYVLRVSIDGSAQDLTFSVTPGRFYWSVGDGQADADGGLGGVGDLLRVLETCIETHSAGPTVVCTLDDTTNWRLRVALTGGGSTIQLLWSHANTTLDDAVFGFNGDTSAASAVVSSSMPQGLWRPRQPVWNDGRPQRPMVGGVARTLTGASRVSDFGTMDLERNLYWGRLAQSLALDEYAESGALTGTFEYAWLNAIGLGRPFRFYEDEMTHATASSYTLWRITSKVRPFQRLSDDPPESLYWRVRIAASEVT